ncbi:MAG: hypothetical protein P0Y65_17165 [Candidatus Devosia phytovorans]|uniref:DUF6538 domain-containing protein n=1 Tax=Candidatus Devosia phytovorans TaxID=3121372 RepID=A0AAJ5VUN1_9HYPH|nr:DUF6538 domain-containing protein [Devosia sp.]WEK03902.1 MAG: hypothetical protein P0Y65_17165 [Devosia sp.]
MVLKMSRPSAHPSTGIYMFRKGVPERLRPLVGKREVKISLGTRDAEEAKVRHAEVALQVDREWRDLLSRPKAPTPTGGPIDLPKATLTAFAGEIYRDFLKAHESDPGEEYAWTVKLRGIQICLEPHEREPGYERQAWGTALTSRPRWIARREIGPLVRPYLEKRGVELTERSLAALCLLAAAGLAQAYRTLIRRARGDYGPDPQADRFPAVGSTETWRTLYEVYLAEKKPSASSVKRQKAVLAALFAFLGHDIPGLVTDTDAVRWKEKRIKEVALQTVRYADLAHPRAFFKWARKNRKIATDPFEDVQVALHGDARFDKQGKRKIPREDKGFTQAEAEAILRATLAPTPERMTAYGAAARRWVPWLCAYTGARVNEITQLRPDDVLQRKHSKNDTLIWMLRITPEAGTTKNHGQREVAVHPHLLEQGFVDWARRQKGERLFYDTGRRRGGAAANPQSVKVGQRIAEWVRSEAVGVTDESVAPNHGWRHRVRSQFMESDVKEQVVNRIDGHAAENVGQKYGTLWPEVCLAAIAKIPTYDVGAPTGKDA